MREWGDGDPRFRDGEGGRRDGGPDGRAGRGGGPGPWGHGPGGPGGPSGPFGPRGGRRASRGDVRAAVLALLGEAEGLVTGPAGAERAEGGGADAEAADGGPALPGGALNGYAIIRAIAERTDGLWRPSPGSVYPTLQQLVDEGLVDPVADGRRTAYRLTEAGRAHVREHAERLRAAWRLPQRSRESAALRGSVRKLFEVIEQVRRVGDDGQRAAAAKAVDEARRALYLILAE